jgi:hypothetical protein
MSPAGGHLGFLIGPKSNNTPPFKMAAVIKNRHFFNFLSADLYRLCKLGIF